MELAAEYLIDHHYQYVKYNEPLKKHTSFRVGGNVKILVRPESKIKCIQLVLFLKENNIPFCVMGRGSNLLPSDRDYDGVMIKTDKALTKVKIKNERVNAGSGCSLIKLAYDMAEAQLSGLEFLGGIPGSIGGAVFMNAGAYNREMSDVVESVTILNQNGTVKILPNSALQYGYRSSIFQTERPLLILEAALKLEQGDKDTILALLNARKTRRMDSQPLEFPSAGSTFRNPPGTSAYLLIDEAGLRGFRIGGAMVSEKHCNFIINTGNATALDIKTLVEYMISAVELKTGVTLKPEIEFFNW